MVTKLSVCDFMDLVTYPVELECAGRALQMDAATEKKVKIINFLFYIKNNMTYSYIKKI